MHSILQNQLKSNSLSHAYLFLGAQKACRDLFNEFADHLDISLADRIQAQIDNDQVKISAVRKVIRSLNLAPHSSRYKLVLVDSGKLNLQAAQALLKTLEEPPAQSIIVLHSPNEGLLLPTLISRCQRIYLGGFAKDNVELPFDELLKLDLSKKFALAEKLAKENYLSQALDQWLVEVHNKSQLEDKTEILNKLLALKKRSRSNANMRLQLEAFFINL